MDLQSMLRLFNVAARTAFNRGYQSIEPMVKGLVYEYESGPVDSMKFPFMGFLRGMQAFTGSSQFQDLPDANYFSVVNKEWQSGVIIAAKEIERSATMEQVTTLNLYKQKIGELPQVASDHPFELSLDMLEVGDTSTYGTCFDTQNLFDTTHNYGLSAGTQSNIITGGGVTAALIIADLTKAISSMNSFYYQQGGETGNSQKRKLNPKMKLLVVCPDELFGVFEKVRTQGILASGEENIYKGRFELVSRPFADASDWYLVNLDQSDNVGLFLYQVEKRVELELPTVGDESYKKNKRFEWNAYGRYNVAYGAWWKGVMITNS